MDTDDLARGTAGEGRRPPLFFSNSTHSQTFRQRSILWELVYDIPYASADNIHKLISYIEAASKRLFKWFDENRLKSNVDKHHFLSGT